MKVTFLVHCLFAKEKNLPTGFLFFSLLGKDRGQIARETEDSKEELGESGKLHGADDRHGTPGAASHKSL